MRLGLISAARITDKALIDPAREIDEVELAAVAARGLDRAAEAAAKWGIATAYGSYEELIDDPSIDAVYIATPASHHMRWTIAALDAGKHVLCEKPLTANASEAADVVAAAERSGRIMMEAFHWRYHPIVGQIRAAIDSGAIGDIRRAEGYFNLPVGEISEGDIRWDLSLGGGALMDLGCYPVQWVRWLIGSEPEVVSATAECPVEEVDGFLRAELRWPTGETGAVECSMIAPEDGTDIRLAIEGSEGSITVENPLAPQSGASITIDNASGSTRLEVDDSSTYWHQLKAFVAAVESGEAPFTSGSDSVSNMALIDACYVAAGLEPRPSVIE